MESNKYCFFCISTIKPLKKFTTPFYFYFDSHVDVDENLKHKIEFIIKKQWIFGWE